MTPTAEEFIKDNPRNPKMQWKLTQSDSIVSGESILNAYPKELIK